MIKQTIYTVYRQGRNGRNLQFTIKYYNMAGTTVMRLEVPYRYYNRSKFLKYYHSTIIVSKEHARTCGALASKGEPQNISPPFFQFDA